MKRLEVWEKENESITDDELPKDRILLRLINSAGGKVHLVAVSPSGRTVPSGHLLGILNEGVTFFGCISSLIGFPLNEERQLELLDD